MGGRWRVRCVRMAVVGLAVTSFVGCPFGGADPDTVPGTDGTSAWTPAKTPCPGSKTNALWFDDRNTGFAGCGENAEGRGLFRTRDGGRTWTSEREFEEVRVTDIRRGPDGVLYGAGVHTLDRTSAWRIEEGAELAPVALFTPGDNAFTSVAQAENVAVTAAGQVFVDSLTGTSVAYRAAGGDFVELHTLLEEALADPDAIGAQVRRIIAFGEHFYATGSIINEPAQVFVPSTLEGATYHLRRLELQPATRDGELLDLHIWSETEMIAIGYDQSVSEPLVFVLDGDAGTAANWTRIDLRASGITYEAGLNALSVRGDEVVAVGEKVPTNLGGCVLRSRDRGRTWEDITPVPADGVVGPLSNVWLFADGAILAAGGGYEAWIQ